MKRQLNAVALCVLVLGLSGQIHAQAPLTLQDALDAAGRHAPAVHHPATALELNRLLPGHCVPPTAETAVRGHAEREARQQHVRSVAQIFLAALQKEDVLLAAREAVASTHAKWSRMTGQINPEDVAQAAAIARAFANYQHALAHRELTLAALRADLRQLAALTGQSGAPASQLEHPPIGAEPAQPAAQATPHHPRLAALDTLAQWWQTAPLRRHDGRNACLEALASAQLSIRSELALQLDTLGTRVQALRSRGLPAAEAELAATEAALDLARSTNHAAKPLYDAMTDTVRAQGAVRAIQHEILLLEMQIDHLLTAEPG